MTPDIFGWKQLNPSFFRHKATTHVHQLSLIHSLAGLEAKCLLCISAYFFLGVQAAEQNCPKKVPTLLLTFIYIYKLIAAQLQTK